MHILQCICKITHSNQTSFNPVNKYQGGHWFSSKNSSIIQYIFQYIEQNSSTPIFFSSIFQYIQGIFVLLKANFSRKFQYNPVFFTAFLGACHQGLVLQSQFEPTDSSSRFLGIRVLFKSRPQANFLDS